MAKRYLVNAVVGTLAEQPDPSTPSGGVSETPFGLYIDTGTGDIYESTGSKWVKIGTLTGSGGGSITDATTSAIGGVEVDHARSGAHSVALTTDGLALPAGMIGTASTKAAAGNDARLSDARTPTAHAATHVGAGGDVVYPGVTTDLGNGLTIQHKLTAGDSAAASVPDSMTFYGTTEFIDTAANGADSDQVLLVTQQAALNPGDFSPQAFRVRRSGSVASADYTLPTAEVIDTTTSAQPVLRVTKHGDVVLELSALQSITGALSAVTDPAAKAVLTSLVAAVTGIKVATDNTT